MKNLSLQYHEGKRPGKIEVVSSKPCSTAYDLSLAYTPGVAEPSLKIKEKAEDAYKYTAKGNLVAVISNGTAVLGLGNIGPLASKPVMEGKGVLFKKFADIDVFDLEIDESDPKKLIEIIASLAPTFGGINLEDIKAPECFEIESELAKRLPIPVFHDDQHGTAIIAGAALLNGLSLVKKDIAKVKIAICGAGAAAIACAKFFVSLGVRIENILMYDKDGVLYKGRTENIFSCHEDFLRDTNKRTLADILDGADVFLGLSAGNIVTADMIKKMAENPLIFALANPTPEIPYEEAKKARPDAIIATGRSDYPNQINNVLGFPFIFRGSLDTRATKINEDMKIAAAKALADLAKEPVPQSVKNAYGYQDFSFGPEYILPKPFDPRVLSALAPQVALAATKSGVAQNPITDIAAYKDELNKRINPARSALSLIYEKAKASKMRIVFPEGDNERVLQAAQTITRENLGEVILLGRRGDIVNKATMLNIDLNNITLLNHLESKDLEEKALQFYKQRARKGINLEEARHKFRSRAYFAAMMVKNNEADGMVAGVTRSYPTAVKPILEILGSPKGQRAMAMYMIAFKDDIKFFADTAVTIAPKSEELAKIAIQAADIVRRDFGITPHVAILSFSNFGSVNHESAIRAREAAEIVNNLRPDIEIDGEMQADVALDENKRHNHFSFCRLTKNANVLIFASLEAANISYKLLENLSNCEAVGPILMGINGAANVCQLHASVADIVHLTAVTSSLARHLKLKDETIIKQ